MKVTGEDFKMAKLSGRRYRERKKEDPELNCVNCILKKKAGKPDKKGRRKTGTLEWERSPGGEELGRFTIIKGERQGLIKELKQPKVGQSLQDAELGKGPKTARNTAHRVEKTLLPLRNLIFHLEKQG